MPFRIGQAIRALVAHRLIPMPRGSPPAAQPPTAIALGVNPHAAMTDDLSLRLAAVVRTDARHRLADYYGVCKRVCIR